MARRERGALLIWVLLLTTVLIMITTVMLYRLRAGSFFSQGQQADHLALLAAESGLADAMARLSEDPSYSSSFTGTLPDGEGSYTVNFSATESVNNLSGDTAVTGPHGTASVGPYSAHLVAIGRSGLRVRRVEAVVTPRALISTRHSGLLASGKIILRGNLQVGGIESMTSALPQPADIFSLSDDNSGTEISWQALNAGDTAFVNGDIRIVADRSNAIDVSGANVTGDRNAYGVNPVPPPSVDIEGRIDAHSASPRPSMTPGLTTLTRGDYYVAGDLVHSGDLELEGANLYVTGRVDINGTITGDGSLMVGGSTSLYGDADITASDDESVAIFSRGDITLQGFDGETYLRDMATGAGLDANGIPYNTHLDNIQTGLDTQRTMLTNYLNGSDPTVFGYNGSPFDRINGAMAHNLTSTTSLPFIADSNQVNPINKVRDLLNAQPPSPTKDFLVRRFNWLHQPTGNLGFYGYAPNARDTTLRNIVANGSHHGMTDVLNDGNSNLGVLYVNPSWDSLPGGQRTAAFHQMLSTFEQIGYGKLGSANFQGMLYTNGSIYSANDIQVTGAVIAIDDGSQLSRTINGRNVEPGDIYLENGSRVLHVGGVEKSAGKSFQALGIQVWLDD